MRHFSVSLTETFTPYVTPHHMPRGKQSQRRGGIMDHKTTMTTMTTASDDGQTRRRQRRRREAATTTTKTRRRCHLSSSMSSSPIAVVTRSSISLTWSKCGPPGSPSWYIPTEKNTRPTNYTLAATYIMLKLLAVTNRWYRVSSIRRKSWRWKIRCFSSPNIYEKYKSKRTLGGRTWIEFFESFIFSKEKWNTSPLFCEDYIFKFKYDF